MGDEREVELEKNVGADQVEEGIYVDQRVLARIETGLAQPAMTGSLS